MSEYINMIHEIWESPALDYKGMESQVKVQKFVNFLKDVKIVSSIDRQKIEDFFKDALCQPWGLDYQQTRNE